MGIEKKKDNSANNNDDGYVLVNFEKLTTLLAESAWKEETKESDMSKLYITVVTPSGNIENVVNQQWLQIFSDLKDAYKDLVLSCSK